MPTVTHQYSDHNQSYVPNAGFEKGRGVCNVDAGAGTPLADLVSHTILYTHLIYSRRSANTLPVLLMVSRDVP